MSSERPDVTALTFARITPILDDVIARWHGAESRIGDWATAMAAVPLQAPEGWDRTVELLQLINTFQWHEEDRSRDHGADDTVLAAVKRSIDASNRRRVQTVDRLDELIHDALRQTGALNPAAPLNSESPGSIVDRLTVLALKIHHAGEARAQASVGSDEAAAMRSRCAMLGEQYSDLGACLDDLLAGLRAGRVGWKLYRQVKLYRQPGTGRVVADLD